ncbi:MAG: superoxide dismutase [Defluviitaleaceae bacterium]|nr:superoxide dismutase [Defluviitaleaceae bacterium]
MKIGATQFGYDTAVVSQKQFEEHIKLYKGYVDKVNAITDELANDGGRDTANAVYSKYRGLKDGESFALAGVVLHEMYFQNMGAGGGEPDIKTRMILEDSFGSYEGWLEDFKACATAARGWCVFCYEQRTRTFRNIMQDTHDKGPVMGMYPLLILDVYEHAYFLDFGTDKASYINKFVGAVNWDVVGKRVKALMV